MHGRSRQESARFSAAISPRRVFYGRPLLEYLARETFEAFDRRDKIDATVADIIKEIHAGWLLTPREDLCGACPRDVGQQRRNHLTWDLQDQSHRWSRLGECPPGLDESTFAYRYGGFGIHELVEYYELVRELLWSCWERLADLETQSKRPEAFTVGDFLADEIPRLESLRDVWLDTPDPELHGRTPRSVIERERARLPEGISGHEAIIDPDCPCCQMLAELPGPVFWHLDGCNMDDDFAFDIYHRTRDEWDEDQLEWEAFNRRFDAEGDADGPD